MITNLASEFFKIIAVGSGALFLIISDFSLIGELFGKEKLEDDYLILAPARAFLALFGASFLFYFILH